MSKWEEITESATTLVAAALEEQIRHARFYVQVSDENPEWAYVVDAGQEPPTEGVVLTAALPVSEARRRVQALRARPYKFLWMKEGASAYLGFGSAVVHRPSCGGYALVMTPAEHAQWQRGRLGSGLQGVLDIYETAAEALVELAHGKALGVL